MGFDVVYVADIQQFPRPLFPKFKHNYRVGTRLDIPAVVGDFYINADLAFPPITLYELVWLVVGCTGYKDGDSWSLIWRPDSMTNGNIVFKDIYFKEHPERKHMMPVRRFDPSIHQLVFVYHNRTGTSKVTYVDFECVSRIPITTEYETRTVKVTPFLSLNISPPGGSYYGSVEVTITSNEPCNIWYTLDGTNPKTDGTSLPYTEPFPVYSEAIVKAIAEDMFGNVSPIIMQGYNMTVPTEPLWVSSVVPGQAVEHLAMAGIPLYVNLIANLPSTIYYTLDGSDPKLDGQTYFSPILINSPTEIRFFAVSNDGKQVTDIISEYYGEL